MDMPASVTPVATRSEGRARLEAFAPRMGRAYAAERNHDRGPGRHVSVSGLSPWVRRRLVTERELVAAALARHTPSAAQKFVEEVVWRGYFKGWLEHRPGVWDAYRAGLAADLAAMEGDADLRARVAAAEAGRTGIACFDAWAAELIATGYLHNHARMWFASIWIFTLGLPWRVGADFFLRHLLDGDPASNTLGWRWVAGLHTRGKTYAARASNIAKYTEGRFRPAPGVLAAEAEPLEPDTLPPRVPLRLSMAPEPDRPTVLLVTEEDCGAAGLGALVPECRAVGLLAATSGRSPRPVSETVAAFDRMALADAAARLGPEAPDWLDDPAPGEIAAWAGRHRATQIVTAYVPTGWVRDRLAAESPALEAAGIRLTEIRDDWDAAVWPHATAGYFKVKKAIPGILDELGLK